MRIGTSLLLKNGACVQSYGWNTFRPLGNLQTVVSELENYECDEIAIIRPIRANDKDDDIKCDIEAIKKLRCMTPIAFGGGLRKSKDLNVLDELPIERLIFSTAFIEKDTAILKSAIKRFGCQSIQCLLSVKMMNQNLYTHRFIKNSFELLAPSDIDFISDYANEIVIYDCTHEGTANTFDFNILNQLHIDIDRLVISGGIGRESVKEASKRGVASTLLDNRSLHDEYTIAGYRCASNM